MNLADPHDANVFIESEIGRIVLIVKPIVTNNTYRTRVFLNIFNHLGSLVHRSHIGIGDRLTAKYGIFNVMDCARLSIVEYNCDGAT